MVLNRRPAHGSVIAHGMGCLLRSNPRPVVVLVVWPIVVGAGPRFGWRFVFVGSFALVTLLAFVEDYR